MALFKGTLLKCFYFKNLKIAFPFLFFSIRTLQLKSGSHVKIGIRAICANQSKIIVYGELLIGKNFSLNNYSRVVAMERITIGNNVTIAQFVSILDHDHGYEFENDNMKLKGYITMPIEIGNNVWIGDKVTILKGVKIGNNVIIGANSLVNKNIDSNCIAAGVPCKKIKLI